MIGTFFASFLKKLITFIILKNNTNRIFDLSLLVLVLILVEETMLLEVGECPEVTLASWTL